MTTTETTTSARPGWTTLLLLIFGGTIAWAIRFGAGYLLVPTACVAGAWVLHLVTVLTALAAAAALLFSLRGMRRIDDTSVTFVLGGGAALNAFFLAAILLEGSGVLFVDACLKGALP